MRSVPQTLGGGGDGPPKMATNTGKVLCIVLGVCLGLAMIAVAAYLAHTRQTVRWRAQHPEEVLPVAELQRQRHKEIKAPPQGPVLGSSLPPNITQTLVSRQPFIDQFDIDGDVAEEDPVDKVATLLGMPASHASTVPVAVGALLPTPGFAPPPGTLVTMFAFDKSTGGVVFDYFPNMQVLGSKQRVLVWHNVTKNGHVDPRVRYKFLPGTSGQLTHFSKVPLQG